MTTKRLSDAYDRFYARLMARYNLIENTTVRWGRRMMELDFLPNVFWNPETPGRAWVNVPSSAGLRFVGRAAVESGKVLFNQKEITGWYTSDDCTFSADGDGLVWGVIYQLPGRGGYACCVPGYVIGGIDDNTPVLDLSKIYYVDGRILELREWDDALRECSRAADKMAADIAEEEREYDRQFQEELEKEEAALESSCGS